MYNGDQPQNYSILFQFLKELYFGVYYWYGIISEQKAMEYLTKIPFDKKVSCTYIVYSPIEKKGEWNILYRFSKEKVLERGDVNSKGILFGESKTHNDFAVALNNIEAQLKEFSKEYKVKLPTTDQLKATYLCPGQRIAFLVSFQSFYGTNYGEGKGKSKVVFMDNMEEITKSNKVQIIDTKPTN